MINSAFLQIELVQNFLFRMELLIRDLGENLKRKWKLTLLRNRTLYPKSGHGWEQQPPKGVKNWQAGV